MHPTIVPFVLGFLLGTIPVAWMVVRLAARGDVTREGSRNVGAFNALRVSRSKWIGVVVAILDGLKGAAAIWLAVAWQGGWAFPGLAAAALGVVAGHNYNLWLSIAQRTLVGGKGFAAAAGALLVFRPWTVVGWLGTCVVAWLLLRRTHGITDDAPASVVATLSMVLWGYVFYDAPTAWLGVGFCLLCIPKILPELPSVFSEARALREAGAGAAGGAPEDG
jgi:acyl-phosphate glycerol 3-phosphate acyltransferase